MTDETNTLHPAPVERVVRCGDLLNPVPLWNQTERPQNHLPIPTKVIDVRLKQNCESGILLKVATKNGSERWLDSNWFVTPNDALRGRASAACEGPLEGIVMRKEEEC